MRLVLADMTCAECGESLTATIPVIALDLQIGCAVCGARAVTVDPGRAAMPIPADSEVAAYWRFNSATDVVLERNGGRWHQC